jgi:predicted FMN-binding regulatory protein PaiB
MNLAEADFAQALHFDGLKKSYTNALVKQIVGFRMVVDNIESAFKLSQNRSVSDQNSIVNNLFMGKASDRVLAEFMKNYLKI